MNFKVGDKVEYVGPELIPFGPGVVREIKGTRDLTSLVVEWRVGGVKCHQVWGASHHFRKAPIE